MAVLMTIAFLMRVMMEKYEERAKKRTRTVMTQSPMTYKVCSSQSRFAPLPDGSFGAWPME